MHTERRADQRINLDLPVYILRRGALERIEMLEASYRGLFVRMASPPSMRELVRLRIDLPSRELITHAVVARVVAEDDSGLSGIGMRLFLLQDQEKQEWQGYLAQLIHGRRRAA